MKWTPTTNSVFKRYNQPHFIYVVQPRDDNGALTATAMALEGIEATIPGALLYSRSNAKLERLSKLDDVAAAAARRRCDAFEVHVPLNAAWLVDLRLEEAAGPGPAQFACWPSEDVNGVYAAEPDDAEWALEMAARGDLAVAELVEQGVLREHVFRILANYQRIGVGMGMTHPSLLLRYPAGAGKTLVALCLAGAWTPPGRVTAVICPAKARAVWWAQAAQYTTIEPYRVLPAGDVRASTEPLESYLSRVRRDKLRGLVIVGGELLADYLPTLSAARPVACITDEAQELAGDHRRWKATGNPDGTVSFERRTTKASQNVSSRVDDRATRAVAIMEAAQLPSLTRRLGMSASPLHDGRPRRLWALLDMLAPGSFGFSSRAYRLRYCAAVPAAFGGPAALDDSGSSNLDELGARLSFMVHDVDKRVTHRELPDTRVDVVYIGREELGRQDAGSAEDIREAVKELRISAKAGATDIEAAAALGAASAAKARTLEVQLAVLGSRKRPRALADLEDVLRSGGKAVLFTGRRKECERTVEAVQKLIARMMKGDNAPPVEPWLVWGHGGTPEAERVAAARAIAERPGPGVLIGTGQAFGTAVDGLQHADFAGLLQLPLRPGDLIQWLGRFDRIGGVPTLVRIYIGEGTLDERVVNLLVSKLGPISELFTDGEIAGWDRKLAGLENEDAVLDDLLGAIITKDEK